jgi:hypothetical protein
MSGRYGRLIGAAAVAAGLTFSAGALAQNAPPPPTTFSPPRAKTPDKPPLLGNIAVAALILGVVVGASLIPSKRGHQD